MIFETFTTSYIIFRGHDKGDVLVHLRRRRRDPKRMWNLSTDFRVQGHGDHLISTLALGDFTVCEEKNCYGAS